MKFDVLIQAIEQTHQHFQHQASKAVNVSLTLRNWLIGFYIVEFELHGEDRAVYGQKLFEEMALRLKNIRGIDRRSLYRFKDFYQLYPQIAQYITDKNIALNLAQDTILPIVGLPSPQSEKTPVLGTKRQQLDEYQVPAEKILMSLSYSHIELLIGIEDDFKRTFYEVGCINGTWSVKELKRQINSLYYERSNMSAKPEKLSAITNAKAETTNLTEIVKSVYAFEFLGLKPLLSETRKMFKLTA